MNDLRAIKKVLNNMFWTAYNDVFWKLNIDIDSVWGLCLFDSIRKRKKHLIWIKTIMYKILVSYNDLKFLYSMFYVIDSKY